MDATGPLKIAAVTDDGRTLSAHFGRGRSYLVYTIEDGRIVAEELREKAGHHTFGEHGGHHHDDEHDHEHDHEHEPGTGRTVGHGTGPGAADRHAAMVVPIPDVKVVLARGMGQGAYAALQAAGIEVFVADAIEIADAVHAYLNGTLTNRLDRLH
ncbi:MAG: NifB/NifX family molybdenum-iron cluster-binding protein [Trueperaceae bacterium]|nr:NifB/NifX family molybdenum-iron cluster-binding protein [Trueperaceae bacterium]